MFGNEIPVSAYRRVAWMFTEELFEKCGVNQQRVVPCPGENVR